MGAKLILQRELRGFWLKAGDEKQSQFPAVRQVMHAGVWAVDVV